MHCKKINQEVLKLAKKNAKRKWVVTSAWPYVNATPHLGNLIGSILSADVFARYLRLKGDEVVFVSGSDEHGTPIAVEAIKQNIDPETLAAKKHADISKLFKDWNISYDNYTHTHNPTHIKFIQDFYLTVQKHGYVTEHENEEYYCPEDKFFLPDRFITGICPYCGQPGARGDQCDNPACGRVLEPDQLKEPQCKICLLKTPQKITTPVKKKTRHWYMDFPKVQDKIKKFIDHNNIIPPNARTMCLFSIENGLPERAITRDLKWGIPAPFEGADEKTIYVWFEAVLGYISAVKEWAEKIKKKPELFNHFWNDPDTKTVYFIGKDNIIFHLLVFPGLLFAYNDGLPEKEKFVIPYNVSSTEFLMYENDKFSKTRGNGIWANEALQLAPADYWRYSLIRNRPEGRDVSFIWAEFENVVNELNDKIGNFIHRTLTFIYNKFDGIVPETIELDDDDKAILDIIKKAPKEVGDLLEQFRLKDALLKVITIASEGNVYLAKKAPWHLIKEDKAKAGQIFNVCLQLSRCVAILLSPFCPESSDKILSKIGSKKTISELNWDSAGELLINPGQKIEKPIPVFQKIQLAEVLKNLQKIREANGETFNIPESVAGVLKNEKNQKVVSSKTKSGKSKSKSKKSSGKIDYKFFEQFHIRTVRIKSIDKISDQKNKIKLKISANISSSELKEFVMVMNSKLDVLKEYIGKDVVYLENIETIPEVSGKKEGFLLTIPSEKGDLFLMTDKPVDPGSKIR